MSDTTTRRLSLARVRLVPHWRFGAPLSAQRMRRFHSRVSYLAVGTIDREVLRRRAVTRHSLTVRPARSERGGE